MFLKTSSLVMINYCSGDLSAQFFSFFQATRKSYPNKYGSGHSGELIYLFFSSSKRLIYTFLNDNYRCLQKYWDKDRTVSLHEPWKHWTLIFQQMIDADAAGVLFTANPITGLILSSKYHQSVIIIKPVTNLNISILAISFFINVKLLAWYWYEKDA